MSLHCFGVLLHLVFHVGRGITFYGTPINYTFAYISIGQIFLVSYHGNIVTIDQYIVIEMLQQ